MLTLVLLLLLKLLLPQSPVAAVDVVQTGTSSTATGVGLEYTVPCFSVPW